MVDLLSIFFPCQLAVIEHHLQKLNVVGRGGIQTAVSGNGRRDDAGIWRLHQYTGAPAKRCDDPIGFVRWNDIGGIVHAERLKEIFAQKLVQ